MKIESNKELVIAEPPLEFGTLEPGDVFRNSNFSFEQAMDSKMIFMKVNTEVLNIAVNIHTGDASQMDPKDSVIVHDATTVVSSNI